MIVRCDTNSLSDLKCAPSGWRETGAESASNDLDRVGKLLQAAFGKRGLAARGRPRPSSFPASATPFGSRIGQMGWPSESGVGEVADQEVMRTQLLAS